MAIPLDYIFKKYVGEYGRYQKIITTIILANRFLCAMLTAEVVYLSLTPETFCVDNEGNTTSAENVTLDSGSACWCFDGMSPGYEFRYDLSQYGNTIVTEFHLVCYKQYLIPLMRTIFLLGNLFGTPLGSIASAIFGRKWTLRCLVGLLVISRAVSTASNSYWMFSTARFFISLFGNAIFVLVFPYACEFVGRSARELQGILYETYWLIGELAVTALFYFLRDRFKFELVATILCAVEFVLLFIVPESPRWLLSQGNSKEGRQVLLNIATQNGRHIPEKVLTAVSLDSSDTSGGSIDCRYLFRSCSMGWRATVLCLLWAAYFNIYYDIYTELDKIGGNIYVNNLAAAMSQFVGLGIAYPLLRSKLGRLGSIIITNIINAILLSCTIPFLGGDVATWLYICVLGLNSVFNVGLVVYTAEAYPTSFRVCVFGISHFVGKIPPVAGPFLFEAGKTYPLLIPVSLMSGLLISCVLPLLLPETQGRSLPQTPQQAGDLQSLIHSVCSKSSTEEREGLVQNR